MTGDSAELHPVEGAIDQAACVASADPLEAADILKILRALLPPDSKMRAQAIAPSPIALTPTMLPVLFAANSHTARILSFLLEPVSACACLDKMMTPVMQLQ